MKRAYEVMNPSLGEGDEGEVPFCGGVASLEVRTVDGPYRITEYDGFESLETPDGIDWW